jgi:hypothetical protein
MNDQGNEGQIVRVERAAPAGTFADVLMQMLANPDIPADKMDVLLRMRREVLGDQAREAFMEHYAALSAELPQVERDGTVALVKDGREVGRYAFTTIENMDTILRPLLQARFRHFVRLSRQQGKHHHHRDAFGLGLGAHVDLHAAA